MAYFMSWKMAAHGAPCRRTFRPAARSTAIYNCGLGTARWNASTTHSIFEHANAKTAKRARPPRSSTVNPSDQQKKGAKPHPVGYDAGKKVKGVKSNIISLLILSGCC